MPINPIILAECIASVRGADTRNRRAATVRHYAELAGISPAHLRRQLVGAGLEFGYKARADRGDIRDAAMAAAADVVANLILASHGDMPTWVAIDQASKAGLIDAAAAECLQPHYVDRYMRTHCLARKPRKGPAQTRRVKWHAGRELQIDSTNCQQWFFVETDGAIRFTETGEVYRNKPAKHAPIIRYVASDPATGCFRVKYFLTEGESAVVTLEFLYWAMCRAEHPEIMPMAGVPEALVMDKGPGNTSSAVENLCAELGIEPRYHKTGHSWAKGSVEKTMHVWQQVFECQLRLHPAASIDELNQRAYESNLEFCSTRALGRTGRPRAAAYQAAVADIKLPPPWEAFVEAARTTRVDRTVTGRTISYEGREYFVGGLLGVKAGDKVQVAKAVLDWSDETRPVRIWLGEQCVVEHALGQDADGNYADHRLYELAPDPVLDQQAEERRLRIASVQEGPRPAVDLSALPTAPAPAARITLAKDAMAGVQKRRVPALLDLHERLGRELSKWEVNSLGWGELVSQTQINMAVAALSTPATETGGQRAMA
jgi:hypothetical protein